MTRLLNGVSQPTILDVGANEGQSVDLFRAALPGAVIHSFEPSPATFAKLMAKLREDLPLRTGMGANARRVFDERYDKEIAVRQWRRLLHAVAGNETP